MEPHTKIVKATITNAKTKMHPAPINGATGDGGALVDCNKIFINSSLSLLTCGMQAGANGKQSLRRVHLRAALAYELLDLMRPDAGWFADFDFTTAARAGEACALFRRGRRRRVDRGFVD